MILTPAEFWPILAAVVVVAFEAGRMFEKMLQSKFTSKEMCSTIHKNLEVRLDRIEKNLDKIWNKLDGQKVQEES
jgi:hypothetical protein